MSTVTLGYAGTNTNTVDYTGYSEAIVLSSTTGIVSIGVRWKTAGVSLKIGITDGSAWFAQGTVSSSVDGWNDVSVSVSLPAGTYYIAFVPDALSDLYSDFTGAGNWSYNNNTNYKTTNFSAAFNVSSQGTPIILGAASQYQNVRYTTGSVGGGTRLPPPPLIARF